MAVAPKKVTDVEPIETAPKRRGRRPGPKRERVYVALPLDVFEKLDEHRWNARIDGGVAAVVEAIVRDWADAR